MSQQNKRQQLATSGYVHQNYKRNVPFVLIKLMKLYLDEYFYWSFNKGDEMKEFLNAKNGEILYAQSTFKINDIIFECTMCPNGWKSDAIGCVQFYVELKYLPEYIENITIYTELTSETIPAFCRCLGNWNKLPNGSSWTKHILKLHQFKTKTSAYFNCKLFLKAIDFKSNCNEIIKNKYYIKPTKIKRKSKYVWNINKELLNELQRKEFGQAIYSPMFDNNWDIKCTVKYGRRIGFYVRCFSYPVGLHSMFAKVKLYSNCENFKSNEDIIQFRNIRTKCYGWGDFGILVSDLARLPLIKLNVEIEIVKLCDNENNNILPSEFEKYGIIKAE